jgi:hypothetical protein
VVKIVVIQHNSQIFLPSYLPRYVGKMVCTEVSPLEYFSKRSLNDAWFAGGAGLTMLSDLSCSTYMNVRLWVWECMRSGNMPELGLQ